MTVIEIKRQRPDINGNWDRLYIVQAGRWSEVYDDMPDQGVDVSFQVTESNWQGWYQLFKAQEERRASE